MRKYLLFFLFLISLNASDSIDVSKYEENPVFKTIEIATNINNIEDAINHPEEFKEVKYFRRYLRKSNYNQSAWYKFHINNNSNKILEKRILTKWYNTDISLYVIDENKNLILEESLHSNTNFKHSKSFNVEPHQKLSIYLNVETPKGTNDFYFLYVVSDSKFFELLSEKELFNNGIFLGILIAMMMYNFFMYFSMNIKSYLYLALYQFFVIVFISDIRYYLILLFSHCDVYLSYLIIKVLMPFFIFVFLILFTKEFLDTKTIMPKMHILLNFILAIGIIFQFNNDNYLIYQILVNILLILISLNAYFKNNKFAFFYFSGFFLTTIFYVSILINKIYKLNIYFEYQSIVQVLTVFEAFFLSMALYMKLKQTVEEKELAVKEVHETEKLMLKQAKFATMGEMIGNIAHQWRQPINNVSSILSNIKTHHKYKKLNEEILFTKIDEANKQLKYMSSTIEDFMNFFSHKNQEVDTSLKQVCINSLHITNTSLSKHHIQVVSKYRNEEVYTFKETELIQVLVILINNSKDAFLANKIEDPIINIEVVGKTIIYEDNAGGIPNKILNKIFVPYFSTKNKKQGTGLGLYIAKQIIENSLHGSIIVETEKVNTKFVINLENLKKL